MKKLLAILLALALLFTLCACGDSDDDYEKGTYTNESTEEKSDTDDEKYEMNFAEGNSYVNKYFGFKCVLDENWKFLTKEEILEQNNMAADILTSDFNEKVETAEDIMEMSTTSLLDGSNMNVVASKDPTIKNLSEEETVKVILEQVKGEMESAGFNDVNCEATSIDFAGSKHSAIKISMKYSGNSIYEYGVLVKKGARFALITSASATENQALANLDLFVAA